MTSKAITNRIILIIFGIFISFEFLIIATCTALLFMGYLKFRAIGWILVSEKELAKYITAIPLSVLLFVGKSGKEILLPKGESLPESIKSWDQYISIVDFIIIGLFWAVVNLAVTATVLLAPTIIHCGRLAVIVISSAILAIYQAYNFYKEEIRFKSFILSSANRQ